jgi:tetratricopeptide (TPR) repeat protein
MNRRVTVIGVTALLSCSCSRPMGGSQTACELGFPTVTYASPPTRSILEVLGGEMLEVVRHEPPIPPDRRFVLAMAELEELTTGRRVDEVQVGWDGSRWLLQHDDLPLGRLAEIPSFADALSLLESHASRGLEGDAPARVLPQPEIDRLQARLDRLRPEEVIEALRQIDAHWREGRRDPRAVVLATRGLVFLDLQRSDEVEVTDGLGAKALAALALARAIGGGDLLVEEALLADRFGYSAHAVALAGSMPLESPVRAYLLNETETLRQLAEQTDAAPLTRYLYLSRLAEQRNIDAWRSWIGEYVREPTLSTSILSTGFLAGRHELTRPLTPILPYLALMEFWGTTGRRPDLEEVREFNGRYERELADAMKAMDRELGETTADLIRRFEQDSEQLQRDFPGPFAEAGVLRAYYGGHLYGSIVHLARYYLDILASVELSAEYLEGMDGAPFPVGDQVERWYSHLVQSEKGSGDVEELTDDLGHVRCLGVRAWMRSFDELQEQLPYADPRVPSAASALGQRLDSRPAHQFHLAGLASARFDLRSRDRFYRSAVHLAGPTHQGTRSWLARASGDTTTLRAMVEDEHLAIRWRVGALEYLIADSLAEDAYLRDISERMIESAPGRWEIREVYLKHLENVGAFDEGIDVVMDWKFRNPDRDRFVDVDAQTALGRLYYKKGEFRRAESAIENVIRMRHAGTVGRAALIFQQVRREKEALRLARWGAKRYPDFAFSRVVLAEVLWRQGRNQEVPEVLNDSRFPLDLWAWREDVAEAFLRVFGDGSPAEAEEAFAEIVRAGVPSWISEALPQGLMRRGRPDLAFLLQAQLDATDAIGSYRNPIRAYMYLKAWESEAIALDWIRPMIPPRVLSQVSRVMFAEGADELLWGLIPDPEETTYPDVLWLTRAASEIRNDTRLHLRELREHYGTARGSDFDVMGRYLLDMETEERVLELARTPERRAQIAYYVGLKAQSEGRISDAIDWYRVVLATGEDKKYEYSFALEALETWKNTGYTVARIEKGTIRFEGA